METAYRILEILFPFSWIKFEFMKNALLAVILISPLLSCIGTMVVNNKMAFFSDALGHSVLTGIGIGVFLGISGPDISAMIFSVIFGIGIILIKYINKSSMDTVISVFSSSALALGIVLLSQNGGINKYSAYLIGDLLTVGREDIVRIAVVSVIVLLVYFLLFNKMLLVSLDSDLAKSRGINPRLIEMLNAALIAVTVAISIKWVGILIINSMLILPAATSRNIARGIRRYLLFSVVFAVICGICGLIISYYINASAGAAIVLLNAAAYFATLFLKNKRVG